MTALKAKLFAGEGNASRTVAAQLPLIAQEFTEVRNCHPGTINVEFDTPVIIASPDHRTSPIRWKNNLQPGEEVFDLLRVSLEVSARNILSEAWIYVAHRSAHRKNLRKHELIAPLLELDDANEFIVTIKRSCIRLPYRHNDLYVVI